MRKVVAIAAAPGFLAGIYIFIASFFGLTMDNLGPRAFLLHLASAGIEAPAFRKSSFVIDDRANP